MDFISWLTSMFGAQAPQAAAAMGIPPPTAAFAQAGEPANFADRFSAVTDNPRIAAAMEFDNPLPDEASTLPPRPSFAAPGAPQESPDFPPASAPSAPRSIWDPVSPAPTSDPTQAMASRTGGSPLANALRGVAAPQVPAAQKVSTPSAPRLDPIKTGELLQFLLATQEGGVPGGRKVAALPGTLGQALNVPRY